MRIKALIFDVDGTLAETDALLAANLGQGAVRRFAVIGSGDEAARKKPAPDIYERVLRELRIPAADCAAIEDSALGLAAAKGAGLYIIVTPSRWTQGEDFSAADLLLPSLAAGELAEA